MVDLKQFCAAPGYTSRYTIERPFVTGGFRWATDTRILVRVPSKRPDTKRGKFPKVAALWSEAFPDDGNFVAMPILRYKWDECDKCDATGLFSCPTCHHEDGCDKCDGSGRVFSPAWLPIGEGAFSTRFLDKLSKLPEIAVSITDNEDVPMPFRFRGGEGLLMPGHKETLIRLGEYAEAVA